MPGFRHLGDETIASLHRIDVVKATFEDPDGGTFERDVIRDKQVVAMVPLLADRRSVVMVRQYRGPIDATQLEIPAGLCDLEGEDDPIVTAQRELAEEVGKQAGSLDLLAEAYTSAGISDELVRVYLATDLIDVPDDRQGVEEAHMTLEEVALDDVPAMIAGGRLTDAKSIIGLLLTRERLAES
jgi:8-oxo-dGTP pyrophosphatase MutT (NUDIX family)